ncbi:MAG: mannitol dehydrogenase family protein [Gammaproteobacteria bacterium]|nr:mannitol dehydrogenase family protein [Gammaproteobacteria bacterium]
MPSLSWDSLPSLPAFVEKPSYDRDAVSAGIVHFGVGNFHRAHQAAYCEALLNRGETDWGIIGVSMRSPHVRDKLAAQDYLYSLLSLGEKTEFRVIGALQRVLVADESPRAVIDAVASSATVLVTCTITEKGYCLNRGELDSEHPDLAHDLRSLDHPHSLYGYLAAALISRAAQAGEPLTVLCCDNLSAGGDKLREGVSRILLAHSPSTLEWAEEHVAFRSSMVDRVTPATTGELMARVSHALGCEDAAPVAAEPFTQWVIEDDFAGRRPPLDAVGALFVPDIAPYEHAKLRLLNAGHSILAALGYLAGDRYIHEALARPALAAFALQTLEPEILPVTLVPKGADGRTTIATALARFRNAQLPYAVLQVGSDSSQKILQRWLPATDEALAQNKPTAHLAFALGAWVAMIRAAAKAGELVDPQRERFCAFEPQRGVSISRAHLAIAGAQASLCFNNSDFIATADAYYKTIADLGIERALQAETLGRNDTLAYESTQQ